MCLLVSAFVNLWSTPCIKAGSCRLAIFQVPSLVVHFCCIESLFMWASAISVSGSYELHFPKFSNPSCLSFIPIPGRRKELADGRSWSLPCLSSALQSSEPWPICDIRSGGHLDRIVGDLSSETCYSQRTAIALSPETWASHSDSGEPYQ